MSTNDKLAQWKLTSNQPVWSKFYDILALSSPLLWWRCASFKRVKLQPILHSVAAVLIPPAVFSVARLGDKPAISSRSTSMRIAYASWSIAWIYSASCVLLRVFKTVSEFATSRSLAKPSAWECLSSCILSERAYRTSTYDVYLPPALKPTTVPILFFPGASVEHTAYAEPAALLADRGYLVVVVSAAPVNLVDIWLPRFWPVSLRGLQRAVECEHYPAGRSPPWVLMGHSMGSFLCTKLAARWTNVSSMVMWASAPFLEFVEVQIPTDFPTLVVQGTNDAVIQAFGTPEADAEFRRRLPPNTIWHDIVDGTHSGFASYTSNWKPEVDGIEQGEQHRIAVQVTDDFLQGRL